MSIHRSPRRLVVSIAVAAIAVLAIAGCGESAPPDVSTWPSGGAAASVALSDTARAGEELFNANCAACHGPNAAGTDQGPTLIDRIYHPNHHSDFSFLNAASRGVQQHHWGFGDMPPVPGVSQGDVEKIICYVRQVQRANSIFDEDAYAITC